MMLARSSVMCGRNLLTFQTRPSIGKLCCLGSPSFSSRALGIMDSSLSSPARKLYHFPYVTRRQAKDLGRTITGGKGNLSILATQATATNAKQSLFYADAGIHRATELRTNDVWLSGAFSRTDTLILPMLGAKNLVKSGKSVYISSSNLPGVSYSDAIFLGLSAPDGRPVFVVNLEEISGSHSVEHLLGSGAEWVDVKKYGPCLSSYEASLSAYARGMIEWHIRHRFCGRCGSKMDLHEAGHAMKCSNGETCGRLSYPRMDPAVIMLITCGNYLLLGRQAKWDIGRYSLLAGFVEIGETFETAVVREVQEEAGVDVDIDTVRYEASQPWPFPASLMVGFQGSAVRNKCEPFDGFEKHGYAIPVGRERVSEVDEVNALPKPSVDTNELEHAVWIHRSFLEFVLRGESLPHNQVFSIPGSYAIANRIMRHWVQTESENDIRWAGRGVPTVDIDDGTFKYVLIRIEDDKGHSKLVVRGSKSLAYHADILEHFRAQLSIDRKNLQVSQLGGGRIEHIPQKRTMWIYSSSQAFGQADHRVTSALLRQMYPLHDFSVS